MASNDTHLTASRIPLIGLLVVQLLVGYEWLMSGLTKIVRGGFPAGLADELFHASPSRYASLLPGYGPTRVMLEGAFAPAFAAWAPLAIGLAWAGGLAVAAYLVLRRSLGTAAPALISRDKIPYRGIVKESR